MKTAMRVAVLMCVVALAGAFLPSAATASWQYWDYGSVRVCGQDSTTPYLAQMTDNTWYHSTSPSGGWAWVGKLGVNEFLLETGWHKGVPE